MENLTFEELVKQLQAKRGEKAIIINDMKEIRKQMDKRILEDNIRRKVENLTDDEKAAMHQFITANTASGAGKAKKNG